MEKAGAGSVGAAGTGLRSGDRVDCRDQYAELTLSIEP